MAYVYVHVFCIHHIHLYIELPSAIYLLFCYAIARGKKGFEGCYLHNKHMQKGFEGCYFILNKCKQGLYIHINSATLKKKRVPIRMKLFFKKFSVGKMASI